MVYTILIIVADVHIAVINDLTLSNRKPSVKKNNKKVAQEVPQSVESLGFSLSPVESPLQNLQVTLLQMSVFCEGNIHICITPGQVRLEKDTFEKE